MKNIKMSVYKEHWYEKRLESCSCGTTSEYIYCKKHKMRVGICIYNAYKKCILCCSELKWNDTENLKILSNKN